MYQKQEIVMKKYGKKVEMLEAWYDEMDELRYAAASEIGLPLYNAMKEKPEEFEQTLNRIIEESRIDEKYPENDLCTACAFLKAEEFVDDIVKFYVDILKVLSCYSYMEEQIVDVKAESTENDDEIRFVIEERWSEKFEDVLNPIMEDGFSMRAGSLDRIVKEVYKLIENRELICNYYIKHKDEINDIVDYSMISRFVDTAGNGEGAIAVYDNNKNEYTVFGYAGFASTGCSGPILEGNTVDETFLLDNPDKVWHMTSPDIFATFLPDFADFGKTLKDASYDRDEEEKKMFETIGDRYSFAFKDDGSYEYEDETYNYGIFEICFPECFAQDDCERHCATITSSQLYEEIQDLKICINAIDSYNRSLCDAYGLNYADYDYGAIRINMLMHSDENEILYVYTEIDNLNDFKLKYRKM